MLWTGVVCGRLEAQRHLDVPALQGQLIGGRAFMQGMNRLVQIAVFAFQHLEFDPQYVVGLHRDFGRSIHDLTPDPVPSQQFSDFRRLRIALARRAPATHDAGLVWQVPQLLDADLMRQGAAHLVGHHDFTTFRSSICQAASPVKTLDELRVEEVEGFSGPEIRFHVRARSFLHNQVRSFVGTLERVGAGTWAPDDVKAALEAKNRAACGPVSPPQGLYLAGVGYPKDPFAEG